SNRGLVRGRDGPVASVRIDGLVAVMVLCELDASLAVGRKAIVDAVAALEEEYRAAVASERCRLAWREPSHYLSRPAQRSSEIGQQRLDPRPGRDNGRAGIDNPSVSDQAHAIRAWLNDAHVFTGADLGAGVLRQRKHGVD